MRECEAVHDVEWEIRLLKRVNKALKVILPAGARLVLLEGRRGWSALCWVTCWS